MEPAELHAHRRHLHRLAELSGVEHRTAAAVQAWLEALGPDALLAELGGTGVAAVFAGARKGPTVVLRCELDAVPVSESHAPFAHRSEDNDCSHKCGHDGHMAIQLGVAAALAERRPARGRVVLLFQPAEETGEGAARVLEDPRFEALAPDWVFGLHNLPRFPAHQIVVRRGTFASASAGLIVRLAGQTTHSSYPEHGRSPTAAVTRLLAELPALAGAQGGWRDTVLLTVTAARLGANGPLDFGVAPGEAEVRAILRASDPQDFSRLHAEAEDAARRVAEENGLDVAIEWHEHFPATVNHDDAVGVLERACRRRGLDLASVEQPFRWSEDFSHYLLRYPGAYFGLGAGVDQPQLHHQDYDFPDELLATGVAVFLGVLDELLGDADEADTPEVADRAHPSPTDL